MAHSEGGRLRKPIPISTHARSASAQLEPSSTISQQPSLQELRNSFAQNAPSGPDSPLMPPPVLGSRSHSRASSIDWSSQPGTPSSSRPGTPSLQVPGTSSRPTSPGPSGDKRRTWFGGGNGKLKKERRDGGGAEAAPFAWVAGHPQRQVYDTDSLVNGRPMEDVWDNVEGNCLIYLFPRMSGHGPSFKVNSAIFASSPVLTRLAFGELYSQQAVRDGGDRRDTSLETQMGNFSLNEFTFSSPSETPKLRDPRSGPDSSNDQPETHLYLPIKLNSDSAISGSTRDSSQRGKPDGSDPATDDLQTLIDIRNFFAFLCGQSLVATEKRGSFFHIFMNISGILKTYEFSNVDGSTFGEVANASFDIYVDELALADVRSSREKTIEGIVLGERMKSVLLYNEAFTHGVGKHDEIVAMNSPKFKFISPLTGNRLYRAAMDLEKRTASIRLILESFEFPALFSGIAASKTSDERKEGVRFERWKEAFYSTRKNVLSFLKHKYGDWPPKAKSKKNDLETSGLNRLVLQDLYRDMCSLYDLMVDRSTLTTRTIDGINLAGDREEPTIRALRVLLSEYDRSTPPVKPPVPFDLPQFPSIQGTRTNFSLASKKESKTSQKKLKDDEILRVLRQSWNDDTIVTPVIDMFRDLEKRAAHGCTIGEIIDLRIGQWIFVYVVLQALPMLACDAPALKWTQGVEYFLCEPPRSGVPWTNPHSAGSRAASAAGSGRTWFSVDNGGGVVSLPSDVLVHSVEGIYIRSHCWTMAEKWSAKNPILNSALHEHEALNSHAGMGLGDGLPQVPSSNSLLLPHSRSSSPSRSKRHSSLGLGLEALPLPVGVSPDGRSPSPGMEPRPRSMVHQVDKGKTFDDILANVGGAQGETKKKGKKK